MTTFRKMAHVGSGVFLEVNNNNNKQALQDAQLTD